jgi:SWIM zinc finger
VAWQTVLDAPDLRPRDPDECLLEIFAILEGTTHVSGIGWRLTTGSGPQTVRTATRRYGRTLIFSELAALRSGLGDALRLGCRRLRIRAPSPVIGELVRGVESPRYRRAALTARRMKPLVEQFEEVRFDPPVPTDPDLHHAVGEALDSGLHRAAERDEHRVHVMERIVERAKDVRLEDRDGGWVANGRYRVELAPMHCECPAWTARWARVNVAGRRAQRLPCKHLVALALHEGISVPADLALLARTAPP